MNTTAYAIIMAGGNGERFWPLSTSAKPKQFLDLFGGKPLIRHAVDRLDGLIPPERIFVVTADRFVDLTRAALPMLPTENIVGEPCRRDTAAAVATACGLVLQKGGPSAVGCILTADQLITPVPAFQRTLADAIEAAAVSDAIVTMGIIPTRADTGFGYIECGNIYNPTDSQSPQSNNRTIEQSNNPPTPTTFRQVRRFVEKPNKEKAKAYLSQGGFLWNAGMFIWKAETMRKAYYASASDIASLIDAIATARDVKAEINRLYPFVRAISVDFAVMEHAQNILVAESRFTWDDVGSWTAVEHHFPQDSDNNTVVGEAALQNATSSVVVNTAPDGHILAVAGLTDVVVVHTPTATLVCSKAELPNLKQLVKGLQS